MATEDYVAIQTRNDAQGATTTVRTVDVTTTVSGVSTTVEQQVMSIGSSDGLLVGVRGKVGQDDGALMVTDRGASGTLEEMRDLLIEIRDLLQR